ncbi:hypothetical protein HPT15_33245, partial [Pseudomonas aeruginosa]|nr:hypothetical protein [Pseudomonas aeruginosa]NPS90781.1 hypothetical protein [Pseudomonas aeruginosa]
MSNPLLDRTYSGRSSAWDRAAGYQKEARPVQQVRKIVLKGAVDVVFFTADSACLVVAGDSQDAIQRITTRLWTCPYQTGHQLPVKLMLL